MLNNDYFHFDLIRKYIAIFGTLFNDIYIERTDKKGNTQNIKVPIEYSPKDKMMARVNADPNINRKFALQTPAMGFEYTTYRYNPSTKLPNTVRSNYLNSNNSVTSQYTPVPYNITFNLYVITKNTEDANKIVEQIIPYFTPDWTVTVELIPEMNEIKDIPVILTGVDVSDNYNEDFSERRNIIWTLTFEMKVWFYKPLIKAGLIRFVDVNIYNSNTANILDSVGTTNPSIKETIYPFMTIDIGENSTFMNMLMGDSSSIVDPINIQPSDPYVLITKINDIETGNT